MAKQETPKNGQIIWQTEDGEDFGNPEPALLLTGYRDVVSMENNDQRIQINYGTIPELIKALRELRKSRPE